MKNAKKWMIDNAADYKGDEPLFLAIDATAEFDLWDEDACPGSKSVPANLLEFAESLID